MGEVMVGSVMSVFMSCQFGIVVFGFCRVDGPFGGIGIIWHHGLRLWCSRLQVWVRLGHLSWFWRRVVVVSFGVSVRRVGVLSQGCCGCLICGGFMSFDCSLF